MHVAMVTTFAQSRAHALNCTADLAVYVTIYYGMWLLIVGVHRSSLSA